MSLVTPTYRYTAQGTHDRCLSGFSCRLFRVLSGARMRLQPHRMLLLCQTPPGVPGSYEGKDCGAGRRELQASTAFRCQLHNQQKHLHVAARAVCSACDQVANMSQHNGPTSPTTPSDAPGGAPNSRPHGRCLFLLLYFVLWTSALNHK